MLGKKRASQNGLVHGLFTKALAEEGRKYAAVRKMIWRWGKGLGLGVGRGREVATEVATPRKLV